VKGTWSEKTNFHQEKKVKTLLKFVFSYDLSSFLLNVTVSKKSKLKKKKTKRKTKMKSVARVSKIFVVKWKLKKNGEREIEFIINKRKTHKKNQSVKYDK